MKIISFFLSLFVLLSAPFSFAADASTLLKIQARLDANISKISWVRSNLKSPQNVETQNLTAAGLLSPAQCASTDLGLTLCTFQVLDGCGQSQGEISLTLSTDDINGLISTSEVNPFPLMIAKSEQVQLTLIGCEDGPPHKNHP